MYAVVQTGSKLARSACGRSRTTRAAVRCESAGVATPRIPAPTADLRNALRRMFPPRVTGAGASRSMRGEAARHRRRAAPSYRLAHAPEERQRSLRDAGQTLAPRVVAQVPADRGVDHVVEEGLVEPARGSISIIERRRIRPGGDRRF